MDWKKVRAVAATTGSWLWVSFVDWLWFITGALTLGFFGTIGFHIAETALFLWMWS